MPTISFSIGGEQHDITGLNGDEVVDMIKQNYIREGSAEPEPEGLRDFIVPEDEMATCQEDCENKLNMTETELISHIRNGGDDRCEECQELAKADAEAKTTPIKKEIDLKFAINVYDEVKSELDGDKLEWELPSTWLDDLYGEIEEEIAKRIKIKLGETFTGNIIVNETEYEYE